MVPVAAPYFEYAQQVQRQLWAAGMKQQMAVIMLGWVTFQQRVPIRPYLI